jgi:hypothetical protein
MTGPSWIDKAAGLPSYPLGLSYAEAFVCISQSLNDSPEPGLQQGI